MGLGEIQRAAGAQHRRDDFGPRPDVRQPADRSPGHENQIETVRLGNGDRRIINIGFDEARPIGEARFPAQGRRAAAMAGRGKIDADDFGGAALQQHQAVRSEMALQMQNPLSGERRQFLRPR